MNNDRDLKILWTVVLLIWLVLNVFFIRPFLNPTYPDKDRHLPIDVETGEVTIWELYVGSYGGDSRIPLPDVWYDPESKRVLRWEDSIVTSRINRERIGRVATTIVLGALLACFYKYRMKRDIEVLIFGIIILSLSCCSLNFISQFLSIIQGLFFCFLFVAPFILWNQRDNIKRFFIGPEHTEQ